MTTPSDKNKSKPPVRTLKEKTGSGGISTQAVNEAQVHVHNNDIDFKPMAVDHLKIVDEEFIKLKNTKNEQEKQKSFKAIVENIMQIKAHGGMFNFEAMSDVATITLAVLENAKEINDDLYQLIEVHNNTIRLIIKQNIKGNGGEQGQALIVELQNAADRYIKKYSD